MILVFLFIFFALFGFSLDAQTLPDRYMVTDVEAGDVLNIRAEPSASADIIGDLGPFTLNVEVLRTEGNWGYVGAGERSGWVSMAFLAPNPVTEGEVPRPMSCFGTEPFWSMTAFPTGVEYDALDGVRETLTVLREVAASNGYLIDTHEGRTLIISSLTCSDGMSDREFGMSATLFSETPSGNSVRTGCCTLQVN